jgi:hypothetical protein
VDTEEMYRRGVADAERDDLNAFYYQHYYPYRRGYDEQRRHLRRPGVSLRRRVPILWLVVIVAAAAGAWYLVQRQQTPPPLPPTTIALLPTKTALPTRTPIFPTKTALPLSPTPLVVAKLQVGKQALVVTAGLRARRDPLLTAPIVASFHEGDRVNVLEGPREADGYIWWKIENAAGSGWSAQRSLDGIDWLRPPQS